ncbi:hypothetical protein ACN9M0_16300 [Streptomyces sp. R-07]|uniref:hypothetical protein n=1 Tax=unclassified Streptomyces TaxID=2593676 RepID=UPI001C0BE7F5|nr:hypothetical protein [Streptomyces sp. YPW6]QWQ42289.1 hypothetical protein KME66_15680 [Streptomyces sp. YPW6]
MSPDLQADAQYAFHQYRTGAIADPYTALNWHALFAVELLCDDLVTGDEVKESVTGLIAVLNIATDYRKAQAADSEEV